MAKSFSVQSYIRGKLEQDFKTFRDREKLGDAEAVRQLLTLALQIKLNDKEDDRPSNRELMEEMYRRIRLIQGTGNLTHTQSFDGVAFHENKKEAGEMRNLVSADVNNKVESYLSGEKKG
ncbi:hypothetical protein QWZ04_22905 [Vibrio tapetis subsp. quintayensis]|uniref:hypothetical protein n=1 Tax=Vibrio tapetis TaxID=52443 RepID=UPI0025B2FE17|nr:hypothetical protein [Vibrio tapetis]MDN3683162.1 hypothetical protein [Vibrio tapetis subsp. quintayensis]